MQGQPRRKPGKKAGGKEKLMKPYQGVTAGLREGNMRVASFYLEVFWRPERNLVEILSRGLKKWSSVSEIFMSATDP